MDLTYVVIILLVVLIGAYFLFGRRAEPPTPPPSETKKPVSKPAPAVAEKKSAATAKREEGREPKPESARPSQVPPPPQRAEPSMPPPPQRAPRGIESHRPSAPPPPSALEKLRKGLTRSRSSEGFFGRLRSLFSGKAEISPDIASEIEEVLITSDVGVETTALVLERVREALGRGDGQNPERVWDALAAEARNLLDSGGRSAAIEIKAKPTVVLLVGVNGAGKTTTIGKLASKLQSHGHKCVLAAGDTFRAAAVQQLVVWGDRVGAEVVRGKEGADPGSVLFDAIKKAEETGADVVLADTAGRLHTKTNLMAEMKKIAKTAEKAAPGAPHEILLVIDATNGQNALAQAKEFRDALPLTGIVLTKLDGTAKGGVVLGITHTLKLPIRFIGLGERPDDLHEFRPTEFVEALLGREAGAAS